ncbi:hypothetical protein L6164_023150 [Bauhinia variegata]|uniref:Uncharacterized protein n=1 Tax=Bauhinia variegata TaxID=167791 RepID=A0ACB9MIP6_BAUVA|nr:hypothetical protein L6164_023150 [Bauhinia variegata]
MVEDPDPDLKKSIADSFVHLARVETIEDVKDHMDEFINASMDKHTTCFKKIIQKMLDMSKACAERNSDTAKEVKRLKVLCQLIKVDIYLVLSP